MELKHADRRAPSILKPFLDVERIVASLESQTLELVGNGRNLSIGIDGDIDIAAKLLEALRDPSAREWRDGSANWGAELAALLGELDRLGWIRDGDDGGSRRLRTEQDLMDATIDAAATWLLDAQLDVIASSGPQNGAEFAELLRLAAIEAQALVEDLRRGQLRRDGVPTQLDGLGATIPGIALLLALRAWQRTSPLALAIFAEAANRAVGGGAPSVRTGSNVRSLDSGLISISDLDSVRKQVWAACGLLTHAGCRTKAPHFDDYAPQSLPPCGGRNAMVLAEGCAERMLATLGESELMGLTREGAKTHRVASGIFLHQQFITLRYMEALVSFLRFRLRGPLRQLGFEYFFEEYGHEVHEREACMSLGLSEEEIDRFAPLPLFEVYPDILNYLAEIDPLALCFCVAIAEGFPGEKKPLPDLLAARGLDDPSLAAHAELDVDLDHSRFPRQLLERIPWLTGAGPARSIRHFLFVVEMSQLGWKHIARYAETESLPIVPSTFGLTPEAMRLLESERF